MTSTHALVRSPLREAIRKNVLADYRLILALVGAADIVAATGMHPGGPAGRGEHAWPAHQGAVQVAVAAAATRYGLRRIVVLHNSVPASRRFTTTFAHVLAPTERSALRLIHVDNKITAVRRRECLDALCSPGPGSWTVLSTVRNVLQSLTLPAVDALVLAAPRASTAECGEYVHKALPVLRSRPRTVAVVLPAFLDDSRPLPVQLSGSGFIHVRRALDSLSSEDPELRAEILRTNGAGNRLKILDGHGADVDPRLHAAVTEQLKSVIGLRESWNQEVAQ